MDDKYPVSVLSSHIEIGELALAECYPNIIEHGTEQNKHEVPRIVFRTCLPPRLKDGEVFNFASVNFTEETVDRTKEKIEALNLIPNSLYYIYVGQFKTLKTPLKTIFTKRGFVPNDIVNKFFDGRIEKQEYKNEGDFIQSYYNEENKIAVVVGSMTGEYFWNVCAAVCPRIIPWYFNVTPDFKLENHPLTEAERELVRAIDIGDEAFVAAAQKIYETTDVSSKIQAVKFKNAYRSVRGKLIRNAASELDSLNRQYRETVAKLEDYSARIRDSYIRKCSLESDEDGDGSEIAMLFTGRPTIAIHSWQGNDLVFTAVANLTAYQNAETSVNNINRGIYRGYREETKEITDKEAIQLMTSVFVEREIKIPVYSNFRLSLEGGTLKTLGENQRELSNPAPKFAGYAPQPHHYYYTCLGTNEARMSECLAAGNYVGAISQAIGSCPYLVFSDECVVEKYSRKILWNKGETPYLLPDGRKVNYIDAVAWLKENN